MMVAETRPKPSFLGTSKMLTVYRINVFTDESAGEPRVKVYAQGSDDNLDYAVVVPFGTPADAVIAELKRRRDFFHEKIVTSELFRDLNGRSF